MEEDLRIILFPVDDHFLTGNDADGSVPSGTE